VIRVVLVDDHAFYREGVRSLLAAEAPDLDVVGEAADGDEGVEVALRERADVVLMDLALPGSSGIEATARLTALRPGIAVLVLTMRDDESVFAALRAGARGYLLKHVDIATLTRSIRAAHHGETILGAGIGERVAGFVAAESGGRPTPFPELSGRERDVLELLARDLDNDEIARRLGLSLKTVRNYIAAVLTKLPARDRKVAGARARAAGWGAGSSR
jgi:DNA-binding NarL/FixJ family response regulator